MQASKFSKSFATDSHFFDTNWLQQLFTIKKERKKNKENFSDKKERKIE
jgi:hypothetical protein